MRSLMRGSLMWCSFVSTVRDPSDEKRLLADGAREASDAPVKVARAAVCRTCATRRGPDPAACCSDIPRRLVDAGGSGASLALQHREVLLVTAQGIRFRAVGRAGVALGDLGAWRRGPRRQRLMDSQKC